MSVDIRRKEIEGADDLFELNEALFSMELNANSIAKNNLV